MASFVSVPSPRRQTPVGVCSEALSACVRIVSPPEAFDTRDLNELTMTKANIAARSITNDPRTKTELWRHQKAFEPSIHEV